LVVSLLLGNCSAWRVSAADSAARGKAALRSGDYAKAHEYFEAALKSQPGQEDSEAGLLETLRQTGAYREAVKRAAEFLAAREGSPAVHLERARVLAALGEYKTAEWDLRRAMDLSGPAASRTTRMDAVRELASLLEELGSSREAQTLWEGMINEYRAGRAPRLHPGRQGYFHRRDQRQAGRRGFAGDVCQLWVSVPGKVQRDGCAGCVPRLPED
jgi:tetratricopeptide (TPR) repeat protein